MRFSEHTHINDKVAYKYQRQIISDQLDTLQKRQKVSLKTMRKSIEDIKQGLADLKTIRQNLGVQPRQVRTNYRNFVLDAISTIKKFEDQELEFNK